MVEAAEERCDEKCSMTAKRATTAAPRFAPSRPRANPKTAN